MVISNDRSKRKSTGGKYKKFRKKKLHSLGRQAVKTKVDEKQKSKKIRATGGNEKRSLLTAKFISVADKEKGKIEKVEIKDVVENKANPQYVRMNVVNKGAIVETKLGKVKVTSRPGQSGVVNGVLVKE